LGDPELAASLLTFALLAPEPPEGAESLRRTLDALIEQQVGTVELVGVPVEAIVSVDGQERDPHFLRSPLYLAPGVREVLVTIRGVSWAGSADVRAGETERMEVVLPEVVAQEIAEEPAAARFPRRRSRVAAWMTTGTAIAGFGVGIGGVLSAASRRQDRDRELDAIAGEVPEYERAGICGRGAPDPESCAEARSAFASSRVWTGVGIAGLGTAALGAGLAVILWTQPREDVTIEATGSGARLSVHF
jgi:hypothetical protein